MPASPQSMEVPEQMLSPAAKRLKAVQEEILARRNAPKPVYIPPAPPPGIVEKTRLEIEEGRRRNAMAEEARANRPVPKADPSATMTPVFRPADFVPNMSQGHQVDKSYKVM